MSTKERVTTFFNEQVEDWGAYYTPNTPLALTAQNLITRHRFALEMLAAGLPPGAKILDVGCGAGITAAELARRGYEAWGLDIAEEMIRHVQGRLGPDRFQVGDIENIQFPDGSFDGIVCLGVMEYLESDDRALREMWRVLKPSGKAVISTPSAICPFYRTDLMIAGLLTAARPLKRFVKYRLLGRPHPGAQETTQVVHRKYVRGKWFRLLRSVGFEPEDWACHSWGWYTLEPFFAQASLCRAGDRFARNPALNWLASNQMVRVRAIK